MSYFYTQDHLLSVREVTNSSGSIQGQFSYSPYGRQSTLQGSIIPDFAYANYYLHARSGLNLTRTRAFDSQLGRWLNRDPIAERGGINLYAYVSNSPLSTIDPSGLLQAPGTGKCKKCMTCPDWTVKGSYIRRESFSVGAVGSWGKSQQNLRVVRPYGTQRQSLAAGSRPDHTGIVFRS